MFCGNVSGWYWIGWFEMFFGLFDGIIVVDGVVDFWVCINGGVVVFFCVWLLVIIIFWGIGLVSDVDDFLGGNFGVDVVFWFLIVDCCLGVGFDGFFFFFKWVIKKRK